MISLSDFWHDYRNLWLRIFNSVAMLLRFAEWNSFPGVSFSNVSVALEVKSKTLQSKA